MAMKKIHLNSTNQLILGFLTRSRGRIAERPMCLMCITWLILGPSFQICCKSLPFTLYNRSSCILGWCRLEWSFWMKWWWILGLFWEGIFTVSALEYCKWKGISKIKRDKKFKIVINKIFLLNMKQGYLWLPKYTSMVELHRQRAMEQHKSAQMIPVYWHFGNWRAQSFKSIICQKSLKLMLCV